MKYDNYDLQTFLRTVENALEVLRNDYNMKISEKNGLILLKYHQFNSPKCHLTNQCRGVILNAVTYDIVCRGFYRFFNVGEPQAHAIDWNSATITEKIDGSLIRFYYHDNKWCIATSGCIDAFDSDLPSQIGEYNSFGELVTNHMLNTYANQIPIFEQFNKNATYLFEIVSVYNRVVVPYDETNMYFLCRILNYTGIEDGASVLGFDRPRSYTFSNADDCITASTKLGYDEEGYVVCDENFNRIKIKSPEYVLAHHIKGEGVLTVRKVLGLLQSGEDVEFLSYFPEYADDFLNVKKAIQAYVTVCGQAFEHVIEYGLSRADINRIIKKPYSGYVYKKLNNTTVTAQSYFWDLFTKTQVQIVGAHGETRFNSFRTI